MSRPPTSNQVISEPLLYHGSQNRAARYAAEVTHQTHVDNTRSKARHRRYIKYIIIVILALGCMACGGCLNRMRGGWNPWHLKELPDPPFPHDSKGRLLFALPFGLLVAILARSGWTGVLTALYTYFSLWVGWGVYMGIGRGNGNALARVGVFDWALGRDCYGASFWMRWGRGYVGMSWRGLLQTAAPGWLLYRMGYSIDFTFSGIAMGLMYELAQHIPSTQLNFERGPPLGEFLWGTFVTFAVIVSVLGVNRVDSLAPFRPQSLRDRYSNEARYYGFGRQWRHIWDKVQIYWVILAVFITETLFVVSTVLYSSVKQTDMRNMHQSLTGLIVAAACFPLVEIGFHLIARNVWGLGDFVDKVHTCCCCFLSSRRKGRDEIDSHDSLNDDASDGAGLSDPPPLQHLLAERTALGLSNKHRSLGGTTTSMLHGVGTGREQGIYSTRLPKRRQRQWPCFPALVLLRVLTTTLFSVVMMFSVYVAITHKDAHDIPCGTPPTPVLL